MTQETQGNIKPKLFISHKHVDRPIAESIAEFLRERSGYSIDIHFSSSPQFQGPRIGRSLTDELRKALWKADALLLIYTTSDKDWSYCMWECGVATDPSSPETNIYVFQCGDEAPSPFVDKVRIDASNIEHLKLFVRSFLADEDFFPDRGEAVNPNVPDDAIDKYAQELFQKIHPFVKKIIESKPENKWQTWPFIVAEFNTKVIDDAVRQFKAGKISEARDALIASGLVSSYHGRMPQMFGRSGFPDALFLKDLDSISPAESRSWIDSCIEQIIQGAQMELVTAEWSSLKDPSGGAEYMPVLCEVGQNFSAGTMSFRIFFIDVMSQKVVPAKTKRTKPQPKAKPKREVVAMKD